MKLFNDKVIPKKWFAIIFVIKVLAGVFLTLIYTYYYTDRSAADIFKYFDDSQYLFDALKNKPLDFIKMLVGLDFDKTYFDSNYYHKMSHWYRPYNDEFFSDTHLIIRFNAFVRFFSFGYIMVHNVFINFISIIGLTFLFNAFKTFSNQNKKLLFYVTFLAPSVLFWGSGILKESIIFLGFGLIIYHFFKLSKQFNYTYLILILLGLVLLTFSKLYLIVALFIPILGYTINALLKIKKPFIGYLSALVIFLIFITITPFILSELDLVQKIAIKQQTFSRFIRTITTNSGFEIAELSDATSLIINIPNALNNTIIRPYFWECNSLFVWVSALENHLILFFIAFTLYFRKKINTSTLNALFFNFSFIVSLFILIGLTTPVFGSIIRYKIPGELLLLISLVLIIDSNKLKNKFPFLKKII